MILDFENLTRIKNALRFRSRGMNISELSRQLKINRNSVSKYLEILIMAGEVESHPIGTSKIYTISQHVPVSAMLKFSSDMILMIAHDGRIIQANDQFIEYSRTSRDLIIGKHYSETGIGLLLDLPIQSFLDGTSGTKMETFEKTVKSDGKEHYMRIKFVRTLFEDGKDGLTIIIDDISDRILAERSLLEKETLYQSIIKNIQDVFYRSDNNGVLIMASPNWATLLGYDSLEECIGRKIADDFYFVPEKRRSFIEEVIKNGSVHDYDVVLKKKDGTPLYVATNSHLYKDATGNVLGIEGIFRDISERQRAAEKIHKYVSQIEFLSRTNREFIELPESADIYEKIARDISAIIPGALIAVSSYDPISAKLTLRSVAPRHDLRICEEIFGREMLGLEFPLSPLALNNLHTGILHMTGMPLYEAVFHALPQEPCEKLEAALNLGVSCAIGFVKGPDLYGNISAFLSKDATIADVYLVEAYACQAAIAIERKIAQETLRKSEELFYEVAEQSPFPLAIIDPKGKFRFINPAFKTLFGYDNTDFTTGREWFLLAFPDTEYRKKVTDMWKSDIAAFSAQGTIPREFSIRCRNGTTKDVLCRLMYLSTKEKCIIFEDLTGLRKADQVQRLLSSIVESTDDAIIGKNVQCIVVSWNDAAKRMYGYTAEEMIGQPIVRIIPPQKNTEFMEIIKKISHGGSVVSFETQRVRKDGSRIDVSLTISPMFDKDRKINGFSTISRDISAKKAEERLIESEEKYRSLVENLNVGVYRSTGDPKGKFIWGNRSLVEILGYPSLDQLQKMKVSEIFRENNGRRKHLDELRSSGFVKNKEIPLKRADGSIIWVSVTALAQFDSDGKIEFINGIVEDISMQKQLHLEIDMLRAGFSEMADYYPDPLFMVNADNKVIAWNTAMESLTGRLRQEIIGSTGYSNLLLTPDPSQPLLVDLVDEPLEKVRIFYPDIKKDGRSLVAELYLPAIKNGAGGYFRMKTAALVNADGKRQGVVAVIQEIVK